MLQYSVDTAVHIIAASTGGSVAIWWVGRRLVVVEFLARSRLSPYAKNDADIAAAKLGGGLESGH